MTIASLFCANALLAPFLAESANSTATATLNQSAPTVSAVSINNGSPITLTANATTTVRVNFTLSANNCSDVFSSGNVTATIRRSGASGGDYCTFSYENCYIVSTTTHNCSGGASANATATFDVYYFAQATDASSSFSSENWTAFVVARNNSNATGSATSTGVELNTLLAIDTTTSTNYGTVNPGENTSSTNQIVEVRNAGNSSSSLNINGTAMCNGSICISTSSQHYATSTFTYGGVEQTLQETATLVSGFLAPPAGTGRWFNAGAMPHGVSFNPVASYKNYLYVVGGEASGNNPTSSVIFSPVSATGTPSGWIYTTALPIAIDSHGAFENQGYLFSVGGKNSSDTPTSTVRRAIINATGSIGTWSETTALPAARFAHATVQSGNYAYVLGGAIDASNNPTSSVVFGFISSTGTIANWSSTTALPGALHSLAATALNGYLYVSGGQIDNGFSNATASVWYAVINATGSIGSWSAASRMPSPNSYHAMASRDGFIYVASGWNNTLLDVFYYALPGSNGNFANWTTGPSLPQAIDACYAAITGGFLYVPGCETGSEQSAVNILPLRLRNTYWGAALPAGTPQGGYTSTVTYTAIFSP